MEKGALIGKGRTADVYAWGEECVLKLFADFIPVQLVEQEYRVARAAHANGLPVPAVEGLVESEGRHGIVFERLDGPSMLAEIARQPWKLVSFARQLAELHAQIHACPGAAEIPAQRQMLENAICDAEGLSQARLEKTLATLGQLPDGSSFCHGDFHPDNILMTARGPFVIDWMKGTRGNPCADVCCSTILLRTGGLPRGVPFHIRVLLKTLRMALETSYVHRYMQVRSATRQQITTWQLPLMAARLREVKRYPDEKQQLLDWIEAHA